MSILTKVEAEKVLALLAEMYPDADCALNFSSEFQLIAAVSLSAQTTDKRVNEVTGELFRDYPDAYAIAGLSQEELEHRLKPLGMYKNKSKNLKAMCEKLISDYNGQVPREYDALIKLPGVGRKTANVVLAVGFGIPRIAVDTHVFRVANRIGLSDAPNELKTELALMHVIPESEWIINHHRLIYHGRQTCIAQKPLCQTCNIQGICLEYRQKKEEDATKLNISR